LENPNKEKKFKGVILKNKKSFVHKVLLWFLRFVTKLKSLKV